MLLVPGGSPPRKCVMEKIVSLLGEIQIANSRVTRAMFHSLTRKPRQPFLEELIQNALFAVYCYVGGRGPLFSISARTLNDGK